MKEPILLYWRAFLLACIFPLAFVTDSLGNDCYSAQTLSLGVPGSLSLDATCDFSPPAQNLCTTCSGDAWFEFIPGGNNLNQWDMTFDVSANFTSSINMFILYSESFEASGDPCEWNSNTEGYTQYTVLCNQPINPATPLEISHPGLDGSGHFFILIERVGVTTGTVTVTATLNGTNPAPANDRCSNSISLGLGSGLDPTIATTPTSGSWINAMSASTAYATKQRLQGLCTGGIIKTPPAPTEDHYGYKVAGVCKYDGNIGDQSGFLGPTQCQPHLENTVFYDFTVPVSNNDYYINFGSYAFCDHGPNDMLVILVENIDCNDAESASYIDCGNITVGGGLPTPNSTFGPLTLSTGTTYSIILDGTRGSQCDIEILVTRSPVNPILPVEIARFAGFNKGDANLLVWDTEKEVSHSHFEIERSLDGKEFIQIGRANAKGTGDGFTSYDFTDVNAVVGEQYYRLKAVDIDGNHFYSNILAVSRDPEGLEIQTVAPNPFNDQLRVSFHTEITGTATLSLIDMAGRVFYSKQETVRPGLSQTTLPTGTIPAGMYLLRIQQGGKTVVKRVAKL